jgi:hypothetical protein
MDAGAVRPCVVLKPRRPLLARGVLAGFSRNSRAPWRAPHEAATGSRVILMTNASWAFAALLLCLKEVAGRPA